MTGESDRTPSAALKLIPTALPGLDEILGGGLFAAGAYLIAGIPGTGKTTLGNQIAFAHAARGGSAVVATLLAESHGRMLAHLHQFAFFDPAAIGTRVHYASLLPALDADGLDGLLTEIRHLVRQHQATLLVIDGTTAAEDLAPSPVAYKRFTQQLQVQATLLGCTTLLLSHRRPEEVDDLATHVDGVLVLARERLGARAVRWVEITKLRGANHLTGAHELIISSAGITVYPRPEAAFRDTEPPAPDAADRLGFGVPGLDAMLEGGLPRGSCTVILGTPGAGKTTSCLHYAVAGAEQGERVLFAGFRETADTLVRTAAGYGLDLGRYLASGQVQVMWRSPLEFSPDAWAWTLLDAVVAHRPARVVVVAISDVVRAIPLPERIYGFAVALTSELRARGATSIFASEIDTISPERLHIPLPASSASMDNGIVLRTMEQHARLHRHLSIFKLRQSAFDHSIREYSIGDRGIAVGDVVLAEPWRRSYTADGSGPPLR